jgi:hypothetical protein
LLQLEPDSTENLKLLALALDDLHRLCSSRYTVRPKTYRTRPKTLAAVNGFVEGLPVTTEEIRLNADEFKDLCARVSRFWPRARSPRGRKQAPLELQLACFLYRLAHRGLPFHRVADKFNIPRKPPPLRN